MPRIKLDQNQFYGTPVLGISKDNIDRSNAARKAVNRYSTHTYGQTPELDDLLQDFLGDLRHFARRYGVNYDEIDRRARETFEEELREEAADA